MTRTNTKTTSIITAIGLMVVTATAAQANNITVRYAEPDAAVQGLEALQAGNVDDAIRYLRRAARHDLGTNWNATVLANLCAAHFVNEEHKAAERNCTKAIRIDRKRWAPWFNRGNARLAQGKIEAAKIDFERANKLNPDNRVIIEKLAFVNTNTVQLAAAE